ncbi:unnamed protein product, partial [Prorocentrum cordatum]
GSALAPAQPKRSTSVRAFLAAEGAPPSVAFGFGLAFARLPILRAQLRRSASVAARSIAHRALRTAAGGTMRQGPSGNGTGDAHAARRQDAATQHLPLLLR